MAISLFSFAPNTKIESTKVNTNFTNIKTTVENGLKDIITDTDASTVTFDLTNKNIHNLVMDVQGASRTLAVSGASTGQVFLIRLVQDSSGSRTVTWWSGIKWPSGSEPTLSTDANAVDAFMFICTAANTYDGYFAGFGLST